MAEPTKSLFERLQERRAALEAGDAAGGAARAVPAPAARPAPKPMKSKAANALTQRPNESSAAFRRRQMSAAIAAGEF
jgi:hypothetical protein